MFIFKFLKIKKLFIKTINSFFIVKKTISTHNTQYECDYTKHIIYKIICQYVLRGRHFNRTNKTDSTT